MRRGENIMASILWHKRTKRTLWFGAIALSAGLATQVAGQTFQFAGSLNTARAGNMMTILQSEKVLATGGVNGSGVLDTAELYDPSSGTWQYTSNNMCTVREGHTAN